MGGENLLTYISWETLESHYCTFLRPQTPYSELCSPRVYVYTDVGFGNDFKILQPDCYIGCSSWHDLQLLIKHNMSALFIQ